MGTYVHPIKILGVLIPFIPSTSACRKLCIEGTYGKKRGRKTWNEYWKIDMKRCRLIKEDAWDRDRSRSLTNLNCSKLSQCGILISG